MRVAVDVTPLLGPRTGIGQFVHAVLGALQPRPDAPELVPYALSGRARARRRGLPPGTRVLPLPAAVLLRCWARTDRPVGDRWLGGVDVVHGTNFVAPPLRTGATVLSVQDTWCLRHPEACPPAVRLFGPIVRRAVVRGAWLHASSHFVAGELREQLHTDRVAVVPFGVPDVSDGGGRVPEVVGSAPYVLAIGALDPRKGLDVLARAFGAIEAAHPDLRLVLAGPDGPARPSIDAAIAGLAPTARARVTLLGAVDEPTRRALLAHATVVAYPSRYEGFGFPVLEAMAAGVPVVASRAGAIPEVAGDAALLVEPDDEHALAAALDRVVSDSAVGDCLVRRGRDHAAGFSWDATAAGLVALWEQVT